MGTNPVREANPSGLERSRVLLQYAAGWGINRYILVSVRIAVGAVTGMM